jgi:hypothetical protein
MRKVIFVLWLAACGGDDSGTATRQAACEHVCSCYTFSSATGSANCVTSCESSTGSTGPKLASNEQCYSCASAATCGTILNGTACQNECATSSP